nr:SDR family NAD(P)-dependent oxidoreductase [uncultured Neokomagataea sp.]
MRVLISGAASGIGRELACRLARSGTILFLVDVQAEGLEQTRHDCVARGADVRSVVLDVRDRAGVSAWVKSAQRLDHVFICAGITGGRPPSDGDGVAFEEEERVRAMFAVNCDGVLNVLYPALAIMRHGKPNAAGVRGRICVMSSVAGFVSYPGTPSYSASKAAVDRFLVAMAPSVEALGITLTSVCCGFVDTAMVWRNGFPMPGLVSVEEAVSRIVLGVQRGKRRVVFPLWMAVGSRLMDLLPPRWAERCYLRQPSAQPAGMPDF